MQKGKYKRLTNTEREEISRSLANKQALAEIARQLGRASFLRHWKRDCDQREFY